MQNVPLFFPFFCFVFGSSSCSLATSFCPGTTVKELLIKCLVSCHVTGAGQGVLLRESTASAYTDIRGVVAGTEEEE